MENCNNNGNNAKLETKVEQIIVKKYHLIVSIITSVLAVVVPVVGFYWKTQYEVQLIKENHYQHIETLYAEIKELKQADVKSGEEREKLMNRIIEIAVTKNSCQ